MQTVWLCALGLGLTVRPGYGQSPRDTEGEETMYRLSWAVDAPVSLGSLGYYAAITAWDAQQPLPTEELVMSLDPNTINAFDRGATQQLSPTINLISDVGMYAGMAAPFVLYLDPAVRADGWDVGLLAMETLIVNTALTQTAKVFTRRLRPYMYNPDYPLESKLDSHDGFHSFYSGHTSASASMAFMAAQVYSHYHPESPWRYAVWGGAMAVPAVTAWARVGAGKHYPTDVLVGYAAGALVGYLVPELHRRWQEKHRQEIPKE